MYNYENGKWRSFLTRYHETGTPVRRMPWTQKELLENENAPSTVIKKDCLYRIDIGGGGGGGGCKTPNCIVMYL